MNVVDKLSSESKQQQLILNKLNDMIDGDSPETKAMKNLIAMVSQTDSTALILGETGTGKDIVAQAIHKCSKKKGPLPFLVSFTAFFIILYIFVTSFPSHFKTFRPIDFTIFDISLPLGCLTDKGL